MHIGMLAYVSANRACPVTAELMVLLLLDLNTLMIVDLRLAVIAEIIFISHADINMSMLILDFNVGLFLYVPIMRCASVLAGVHMPTGSTDPIRIGMQLCHTVIVIRPAVQTYSALAAVFKKACLLRRR